MTSKIAFVFPGQGSQKVGMGQDVHAGSDAARRAFEEADEALGFALSAMCFEGPAEALKLTENTQPAIVATSVALLRALDVVPDVAAGHSLGEYTAHVAAGTLAFGDAIRVCRQRGQFMQDAVPVGAGAMAAVLKAERALVEEVCAEISESGNVVEPANYNSPGQIVIAGAAVAVAAASEILKTRGARAMPLPVSAPFHSSLMRPAEEQLSALLAQTAFEDPAFPVYVNVDARPVRDAAAARDALCRQVSRPVRWEETVHAMVEDGVSTFVEIGPGAVLSGLIKRIAPDVTRLNVSALEHIAPVREALAR